MTTPSISNSQPSNDANNNSSTSSKAMRRQKSDERNAQEEEERILPRFVFDPDSALVCYWTAAVAVVTLYNAWTIALRIAFPEMRITNDQSYLPIIDVLCDLVYVLDIIMQLRTAYLQDGIPVFDPQKIRHNYLSQTYFIQDVICVLPSHTLISLLPDEVEFCKHFLCSAGAARLTKLLKFHILYKFYDLAESFTSNPHLIRVLRLFLNLTIIIHWTACLYYLLSEYEGLGSNDWVYTNATDQQRFSRKYLKCLYWSAMTLTTIGDTNTPETDLEYIFTGVIFLTGVFVFAAVMGNVGDVISSMNANRQEFQARMDHIQMYLTHKKVPASLQLKIKKWAEYTWSRTKATDESRLLNMLPERLRAEVAVHVHLDSLKKVKIFEQCETGFLCELVLKLRSQVFSPGDYVCRVGETGREMFIINHGKVEVIVNNPATSKPMVVAVLSEGNYFGEISLLRLDGVQNRRTADVRSIGYSELLCLSRRDLMAALVEYPEAKSVLEDQAKKRMKTNLQAQRAFSVDTLLRSSQEQSSMDSGIVKDEVIGHDVSEIKAMIEELKNANKIPGRSVWQMIAKCEVLQAKLTEKEKEVKDSKHRIKDLENLLFSRHCPKHEEGEIDTELLEEEEEEQIPPARNNNVTRQYSQDEGRQSFQYLPKQVPDLKVTPSSEAGSSSDESPTKNNNFIKTSKITNIFEKPSKHRNGRRRAPQTSSSSEVLVEDMDGNYQDSNFNDAWNYNYTNETSIDHEILFDDQQISMTTRFRDEFHLGDSLDLNVHTILEESEDESSGHPCYSDTENVLVDKESEHGCYDDHDDSLLVDARPLSFRNHGRVTTSSPRKLDNGLDTSEIDSGVGSTWNKPRQLDRSLEATSSAKGSGLGSKLDRQKQFNNGLVTSPSSIMKAKDSRLESMWNRPKQLESSLEPLSTSTINNNDSGLRSTWKRSSSTNGEYKDISESTTTNENLRYKDSGFRPMFDRLSSTNDTNGVDKRIETKNSSFRYMWKRSDLTNDAHKDTDRPTTPDENMKFKDSALRSMWNRLSSTNDADEDIERPTTSDENLRHKSSRTDRDSNASTTPDEYTMVKLLPEVDASNKEHRVGKEQSCAQEIKRLLDGQASKSFKCVNGMDFLRMTSMRSLQSDNLSSRRSSWDRDSECDSEDDYASS